MEGVHMPVSREPIPSKQQPELDAALEATKLGLVLPDPPTEPHRLHEATDNLNSKLLDVEAALNELNLGVSASVEMFRAEDGDWMQCLAYRKEQGAFKLVVEAGHDSDDDRSRWHSTPLTSASRETRLEALEFVPKLYKKLLETFEAEIKRVNKGIVQAEGLARAIRGKAGKQ
jgi:hypothetical protein